MCLTPAGVLSVYDRNGNVLDTRSPVEGLSFTDGKLCYNRPGGKVCSDESGFVPLRGMTEFVDGTVDTHDGHSTYQAPPSGVAGTGGQAQAATQTQTSGDAGTGSQGQATSPQAMQQRTNEISRSLQHRYLMRCSGARRSDAMLLATCLQLGQKVRLAT